jgi:hypothetical protein
MLPFTSMLLRLSLAPLEIAQAYSEAFSSTGTIVAPKLTTPKADPSKGTAASAGSFISFGNQLPPGQSTFSGKAMSTQFYENQVATVDYQILFTKPGKEALLDSGRVIVTSAMAANGFASWQISLFTKKLRTESNPLTDRDGIAKPADWTNDDAIELAEKVHPWNNFPNRPPSNEILRVIGLKPENLKYLQIDYQVISTLDRKPPTSEVAALREIASAIKNRP